MWHLCARWSFAVIFTNLFRFAGLPNFASQPSSPGVMSPHSPFIEEGYSRSSADGFVVPRLRTLEAQAQVQSHEIALLRQLGDDLGSWRYRVDSASNQTAHVLHHLNKDVDTLKSQIAELSTEDNAAHKEAMDNLVSQMRICYRDLQETLNEINASSPNAGALSPSQGSEDGIAARLQDVELQLATTQALLKTREDSDTCMKANISDVRAALAETGAIARAAAADASMAGAEAVAAADAAAASAHEISALSVQVQTIRLGLEVVEQSLEDLDVTETLGALRSRVDDLDAGIEHAGDEALAQVAELAANVEYLRREISHADEVAANAAERACRAEAAVAIIGDDVAALRRDVRQRDLMDAVSLPSVAATPLNTAPPSPANSIPPPSSDPRLKAAVHTLSDGYRSLHRAMSLMYEEQNEVASKVATVGIAAQASQITYTKAPRKSPPNASRVRTLNLTALNSLSSHPVALTARTFLDIPEPKVSRSATSHQVVELKVLVAAQAAEASRQQRRADALESELGEIKRMLASLAPTPVDYFQKEATSPPASSEEEEFYQAVSVQEEVVHHTAAAIVDNTLMPNMESSIATTSTSVTDSSPPESLLGSIDDLALDDQELRNRDGDSMIQSDISTWVTSANSGISKVPKPSPARCNITRASAAAAKHTQQQQQNGTAKPALSTSTVESHIGANWPQSGLQK